MSESADPLAFTPVPSATGRRDGWTPERQRQFIEAAVAARAGLGGGEGRRQEPQVGLRAAQAPGRGELRGGVDAALDEGFDDALHEVLMRIHQPIVEPVMRRGRKIGERHRHDNKLLIAVLNARARLRAAGAPKQEWDL